MARKIYILSKIIIVTLTVLVLFAAPTSAFIQLAVASEPQSADLAEIVPFEAVNYYLARHPISYSVAITGFLSPEVRLPAKVEVAVPAGSEIIWFGEPLGSPGADDAEFEEPFNVRTEAGLDIYTAILRYYPAVQIEYDIIHNPVKRISEGIYSLSMKYTPLADTPLLRLMTNLPPESVVDDSSVQFMGADEEGYLVFMRLYENVSSLQLVQSEIVYRPPIGTGMIIQEGNLLGGMGVAIGIVAAVIVITIAFIYTARRRKGQAG